ncbi:predicted protein [Uncinocarpus reesii 1704]|uniref:Uncharacterized protein n=1 Tax=Uncinocarpus reesii (strain UAMH 1704) TaxID=336963 RepID=C4JTL1_UNCRE|nr:uncharacterized protein UREG_05800 [Uncinocarpus reesii 1704]EEP80958.1 predicted protein [Uncinocarpus reesii 1704]
MTTVIENRISEEMEMVMETAAAASKYSQRTPDTLGTQGSISPSSARSCRFPGICIRASSSRSAISSVLPTLVPAPLSPGQTAAVLSEQHAKPSRTLAWETLAAVLAGVARAPESSSLVRMDMQTVQNSPAEDAVSQDTPASRTGVYSSPRPRSLSSRQPHQYHLALQHHRR